MTEYFTKMRVLWDELDSFRPDLICNCSAKCSCDLVGISHQRKMKDHIMQFLRGLNKQYSKVTSHVLMMDPIPSISKIFSYVVQQERQIGGRNFFNGAEAKINSTIVTCSYCKKTGHIVSICYRKHGFPGSNNTDNKNTSYAKKVCSLCGRNRHIIENCYKKHGFPPGYKASNKNNIVNNVDTIQEAKNESGVEDQDFKLSHQQYQVLMSLLKQSNGNGTDNTSVNQVGPIVSCNMKQSKHNFSSLTGLNNHNNWIIDSRATDHISCSFSNLISSKRIPPINFSLPDGTKVHTTHLGVAKIFESL